MGRRKTVFKPPVLKDRGGDLSKDWFIEIQFRDPRSDELVRRRMSSGLNFSLANDDDTRKARREMAVKLIADLDEKLKTGWTPVADFESQFSDNLEYHQLAKVYGRMKKSRRNIRRVSSLFLQQIKPVRKTKTVQSYTSKLRKFANWCEVQGFDQIDVSFISNRNVKMFFEYLCNDQHLDKNTVKKYRQNLYSFFKWCIAEKIVRENPVHDVMIPEKKVDAAARPIFQPDMERLLTTIERTDPQLHLACLFQYYTAIRPGTELRLLKISDIDFYNGSITVNDVQAKKERHETVDMPKQLVKICTERYLLQTFNPDYYVFGRNRVPGPTAMGANTMRDRFNRVRDALNLPAHYKFYSFKHTGAGRLLESGATLVEVQNHLRHKDISDTQAYVIRHFGRRNKKVIDSFPDPIDKK
jgi:site-specific recombinase XerD